MTWLGSNKGARFCRKCGAEMETAERMGGFDEETGARIVYRWRYCPASVVSRFLWFEWEAFPCENGTPHKEYSFNWD